MKESIKLEHFNEYRKLSISQVNEIKCNYAKFELMLAKLSTNANIVTVAMS